MNLSDWLDAEPGRLTAMAGHFQVTQAAVTHWRTMGVPVGRMRGVVEFTDGAVTYEDMVSQREARRQPKPEAETRQEAA